MRPAAQTGASITSRSSSTSNAFWNPYNHPSETSSRSSSLARDDACRNNPCEDQRATTEDTTETVPPPGGFLCPDGGYFHMQLADSSSDEEGRDGRSGPPGPPLGKHAKGCLQPQPHPPQLEGKPPEAPGIRAQEVRTPGPCKDTVARQLNSLFLQLHGQ